VALNADAVVVSSASAAVVSRVRLIGLLHVEGRDGTSFCAHGVAASKGQSVRIAGRWISNQWSPVLSRTLLAPQSSEHAGWRWRGGQAMIPVLLAQTDQTFTMVLYHADAPSYLRTRAKHLLISRQCDPKA
jgi:hypothetical protein